VFSKLRETLELGAQRAPVNTTGQPSSQQRVSHLSNRAAYCEGYQMSVVTKRFYRPQAVTEHFCISTMTLWRWEQEKCFPKPLRRGRVVLYDILAIEEWLVGATE